VKCRLRFHHHHRHQYLLFPRYLPKGWYYLSFLHYHHHLIHQLRQDR
jgi:hypothetical protein